MRIDRAEKNNAFNEILLLLSTFAIIMKLIIVVALITDIGNPMTKENIIISIRVVISRNLL